MDFMMNIGPTLCSADTDIIYSDIHGSLNTDQNAS